MNDTNEIKYQGALAVVALGLVVIGALAYLLPTKDGAWKASDVLTLIGSLTTFIGTIVGSFLGVQVGAAGKQKAETVAQKALAALQPEVASRIASGG
jgi:hypothetical protein